jgi:hypothetical protein
MACLPAKKAISLYPMTAPPGRGFLAPSVFKRHHAGDGAKRYADGHTYGNTAEHQPAHGRAHGTADGHAERYSSVWIVHANRAPGGPKGSIQAKQRWECTTDVRGAMAGSLVLTERTRRALSPG